MTLILRTPEKSLEFLETPVLLKRLRRPLNTHVMNFVGFGGGEALYREITGNLQSDGFLG